MFGHESFSCLLTPTLVQCQDQLSEVTGLAESVQSFPCTHTHPSLSHMPGGGEIRLLRHMFVQRPSLPPPPFLRKCEALLKWATSSQLTSHSLSPNHRFLIAWSALRTLQNAFLSSIPWQNYFQPLREILPFFIIISTRDVLKFSSQRNLTLTRAADGKARSAG